ADVAAKHKVALGLAQRLWNRAARLDRRIGETARGIEHVRFDKCLCGTRVEACATGAAVVWLGSVRCEFKLCEERPQEKVRPELAMDQAGILPHPANASLCSQCALEHRARIDVRPPAHRTLCQRLEARAQGAKSFAEDVMVILSSSVACHPTSAGTR